MESSPSYAKLGPLVFTWSQYTEDATEVQPTLSRGTTEVQEGKVMYIRV